MIFLLINSSFRIILLRFGAVYSLKGFPGGSEVKNLSAVWETWVRSLGWEDPLE